LIISLVEIPPEALVEDLPLIDEVLSSEESNDFLNSSNEPTVSMRQVNSLFRVMINHVKDPFPDQVGSDLSASL